MEGDPDKIGGVDVAADRAAGKWLFVAGVHIGIDRRSGTACESKDENAGKQYRKNAGRSALYNDISFFAANTSYSVIYYTVSGNLMQVSEKYSFHLEAVVIR